jgi:hypothetical protein
MYISVHQCTSVDSQMHIREHQEHIRGQPVYSSVSHSFCHKFLSSHRLSSQPFSVSVSVTSRFALAGIVFGFKRTEPILTLSPSATAKEAPLRGLARHSLPLHLSTSSGQAHRQAQGRRKKSRPPYMHESALFIRKWYPDHKGNFLVSDGLTRIKNFLHKNYFCSKHNALFIRCRYAVSTSALLVFGYWLFG